MDNPQRVRAPERATRSARRLFVRNSELTEPTARLSPAAVRRVVGARLRVGSYGPSPLAEDRQKPRRRLCGTSCSGRFPPPGRKARNA